MIRPATTADRPSLLALQAELDAPRPHLLDLAVGDSPTDDGPLVLVACRRAGGAAETADGNADGDKKTALLSRATGPGRNTGRPVGYLLAVPGRPDHAEGHPGVADRSVHVAEVVVAPGHRREGHGTALVEAAAARFSGYDQLRLTVRAGDEGALAFYRANGFEVLDVLPGHYERGEEGLLLAREVLDE